MEIYRFLEKTHADLIVYIIISLLLFANYFSLSPLKYTGIAVSLLGFALWVWGLFSLKDSFQIKAEAKKLVTSGVYSKIRHPIYYGGSIVDLGWFFYSIGTVWFTPILIVLIVSAIIQIPRVMIEEKLLQKNFGERYLKYKSKTWF